MDYVMKSRIIRLSQSIAFILLALYLILFLMGLSSFGSAPFDATQGVLPIVFVALVFFILASLYVYFNLFTPEEKRRFMLESSGALKGGQAVQMAAETFDLVPGERILFTTTSCFVHIENAFGYWENSGDVTVTDKRIRLAVKGMGSMKTNYWRNIVKEIPASKSLWEKSFTIKKISYEEETGSGRAAGFIKIAYSGNQLIGNEIEMKIYHPRAKEICDIFSKTGK
jgi:hypothetical protein